MKKNEWIPVKSGLPKEDEAVLICFDPDELDIENDWSNGIDIGYLTTEWDLQKWRTSTTDVLMEHIVAWMPLPKPYKGES